MIVFLLITVGVLEAAAFALFAHDKAAARRGDRRVPERTLLFATLWGGVGAWLACGLLRHKTRKEPFRTRLGLVLALHLIGMAALFWLLLR